MNRKDTHPDDDLRDKTRDIWVEFSAENGARVERRFRLRESSREELDHCLDLHAQATDGLKIDARRLGTAQKSPLETVKATLHLAWEHLAPVVVWCLREPLDGPPVTSEQVANGLNERKCLRILAMQGELDGLEEQKKRLEMLTDLVGQMQSQADRSISSTTELHQDTDSP